MGLIPWALTKVPRVGSSCAMGFLVCKLVFRCIRTGRRPLRIAEKIGVFILDRRSAKLGLTYFAVRVVATRQRTANKVDTALGYTGLAEDELLELGISPDQMLVVLRVVEEVQDLRSLAGFKFVEILLSRRAVDSKIGGRYSMPGGRFNVQMCLAEYYSSPRMQDFQDVVARGTKTGWSSVDKATLQEVGGRVWREIQARMRDDLVDLFLL